MKVAVAGGTGVVGRWTVSALRQAGNEPVVLARSTGVDLVRDDAPPAGLAAALAGCDAVIDVSNIAGTKAGTWLRHVPGGCRATARRSPAGCRVASRRGCALPGDWAGTETAARRSAA
jgi:hypothetical protein